MNAKEKRIPVEDRDMKRDAPEQPEEMDPVEQLQAERDEFQDKYQRALADFQNFRRRAHQSELEARRSGEADAISSVLSVIDYFDLALKQDPATATAETILQGVEMIKGELLRALSQRGVELIMPAPGETFDPLKHEAVQKVNAPNVEPGCIVDVAQPGFMMDDRVLRAAKVIVAGEDEEQGDDAPDGA